LIDVQQPQNLPLSAAPDGFRYLPGQLDPPEQAQRIGKIGAVIRLAPLFVPAMACAGPAFFCTHQQPRRG